jgi:hypothetical protein
MALFFDHDWFDERLRATGQTRSALAKAAGMSLDEVELVFHDQRELQDSEVLAFAHVLSADPSEIATRAGAPEPGLRAPAAARPASASGRAEFAVSREAITGLHERLDRLERLLELVIRKLDQPTKGRD